MYRPYGTGNTVPERCTEEAATLGTVTGSGLIVQSTPYARRQYYEHKKQSKWFERMKNRHKDSIQKEAGKIACGK